MRKLPTELRRHPTSVALSVEALSRLEILAERLEMSRSQVVERAIQHFWDELTIEDEEPSDDVDEIGYNPYTGQYEEDI